MPNEQGAKRAVTRDTLKREGGMWRGLGAKNVQTCFAPLALNPGSVPEGAEKQAVKAKKSEIGQFPQNETLLNGT